MPSDPKGTPHTAMDLESYTLLAGVTTDMIPSGSSVFWRKKWGGEDLRVGGLWNWGEVLVHSHPSIPPHPRVPAITLPPEPLATMLYHVVTWRLNQTPVFFTVHFCFLFCLAYKESLLCTETWPNFHFVLHRCDKPRRWDQQHCYEGILFLAQHFETWGFIPCKDTKRQRKTGHCGCRSCLCLFSA